MRMSEFPSRLGTEVIKCDSVKWKSVVLLCSALEAKEHTGKWCVVEVADTLRHRFPMKATRNHLLLGLTLHCEA